MSDDYLGAMPRLTGAPAYARPQRSLVIDRPFDPDDLPLEAHRSASDQAFLAEMVGQSRQTESQEDGRSLLQRAMMPFGRRDSQAAESGG